MLMAMCQYNVDTWTGYEKRNYLKRVDQDDLFGLIHPGFDGLNIRCLKSNILSDFKYIFTCDDCIEGVIGENQFGELAFVGHGFPVSGSWLLVAGYSILVAGFQEIDIR